MIAAPPLTDEADQVLYVLTADPQPVATVAKRLRMTKAKLQQVIATNRDALVAAGVQLHVATASEVKQALQLAGGLNDEPVYYAKLSRPGATS